MTPFQALYGRAPPNLLNYVKGQTPLTDLDQTLSQRQHILNTLKENLWRSRLKMQSQANKKRRECTFEPGELVLLKLQPYRQQTVQRRVSSKLAKRYYGPFKVLRRIGAVSYELELPAASRIHPVIHVSQIRAYHGDSLVSHFSPIPPELEQSVIHEPLVTTGPEEHQDTLGGRMVHSAENGSSLQSVTPQFPVLKISLNKSHKIRVRLKRSVTFHLKNNLDNHLSFTKILK